MSNLITLIILGATIATISFACAPTANNASLGIDGHKTGGRITIQGSDRNQRPKEVQFVNSGDREVFEQVKETSVTNSDTPNEEIITQLAFRESIQAADLYLYKDGQLTNSSDNSKFLLIIKTEANNSVNFHQFITESDQLKDIPGTASKKRNDSPFVKNNKFSSNIKASIHCLDEGNCDRATITLTIDKTKDRNYDITATIGISRQKVKLIVQNNDSSDETTKLEDILNNSETNQQGDADKVSVVVADGTSYSDVILDDELTIHVPVTDPRESDAVLPNENVTIKDTEVSEVVFQGVSPNTGSIVVDVTTVQPGQENTNESEVTDVPVNTNDSEVTNEPVNTNDNDVADEPINTNDSEVTDEPIKDQTVQNRIIIITEADRALIEDGQITDTFNINTVKAQIESGEATWGDVGVNPRTSLFFKDIQNEELLKEILTQEAEFEALRSNPEVEKHIANYKGSTCKYFSKNMAPIRTIIAEAYLKSGLSPNFAVNTRLESFYGLGSSKQNIGKYDIAVNAGCHTASGPFQINYNTYKSIIKRAHNQNMGSGYAGDLVNNSNFEFIHIKSKVDFNPNGDGTAANPYFPNKDCSTVDSKVYANDHRMFVEPGAILASSLMAYNQSRFGHDSPLSFASYKQGAHRYYNKNGETRFEGLSLIEISHFNMTGAGISENMQAKYEDGIDYALQAIALRSILTQPENYCSDYEMTEDSIIDTYEEALEKLKNKDFQKELHLFHPKGPILPYSKEIT